MSTIYKMAKKYYEIVLSNGQRMWTKEQVKTLVQKNKLTENEYKNITGEDYGK